MKTVGNWKKIVSLLLMAAMLVLTGATLTTGVSAADTGTYSGTCGDNLTWLLNTQKGVLTISGSGAMTELKTPSTVPWADYTSDITRVVVENGVTSIGGYAFYGCDAMTNISLPQTLETIGTRAFHNCRNLSQITIPSRVTSIGNYCFYGCGALRSVSLPSSLNSILPYTFYACSSLSAITIPSSVTSIGVGAFHSCTGLTQIELFEGLVSVGASAFSACRSLRQVTIPSSVTLLGKNCFENSDLQEITYCGTMQQWEYVTKETNWDAGMAYSLIYVCGGALGEDVTWSMNGKTGVLTIDGTGDMEGTGDKQAPWCDYRESIQTVKIGYGVTSICDYAFQDCEALTSITIPATVTKIGKYAFRYCTALTRISLSPNTVSIGDRAFSGCSSLSEFTVPPSLTEIGSYAFDQCTSLQRVLMSSSVTSIGNYAFSGCSTLQSISLPSGLSSLGMGAFQRCSSLKTIVIPEGVTTLMDHTFRWCSELTTVSLPASLTTIGNYAFRGCSSLAIIDFGGDEATWEDGVYKGTGWDFETGAYAVSFSGHLHAFDRYEPWDDHTHKLSCECGDYDLYPHEWSEATLNKPATHTEEGEWIYVCLQCGTTRIEPIPTDPTHTYGDWTSDNDEFHEKLCECGDRITEMHMWDDGCLTVSPTHLKEGTWTYTCTECGATMDEVLEKLPDHTYSDWGFYDGESHAKECACGSIVPNAHVWDAGTLIDDSLSLNDTPKRLFVCAVCGVQRIQDINTHESEYILPDGTSAGDGTRPSEESTDDVTPPTPFEENDVQLDHAINLVNKLDTGCGASVCAPALLLCVAAALPFVCKRRED